MLRSALFALVAAGCLPVAVLADPPSLGYALPAAAMPGYTVDVTFVGANLTGATGLWTNMPTQPVLAPGVADNGKKADQVTYRLLLPADAQVGIYGVRVAATGGVSNLRLLMIDDLPSVVDNGANKSPSTPQDLNLPVAVDGACEAESQDYYRFPLVSGQRVSIEAVARRLGSPLDPVIRLLDATGREVAYSDDEPGLGADSRLAFRAPASGTYTLEIRDIRYAGDANHRYRLRLGDFPLANTTYPMAGRKGTTPKFELAGAQPDDAPPMSVKMPGDVSGDTLAVGAKYPGGQGSAALRIAAATATEQVELEPNDTPETAAPLALAGAINGRFAAAKDRDYFQFDAKAGQRFIFSGRARSLGSPSDLFLRLLKADGGVIAEAEDAGDEEGKLDVTIPADGTYRLMAEDLLRRGGPDHVYRVAIEPYRPGFTLAVEGEKFDAPRGGVFVAKVTCNRRDYEGPIALSVEGAGEGLQVSGNVIGEKAKETVLNVTLPANFEPGRMFDLRVVGRAKIGDAEFAATASTLGSLRAGLANLAFPPASLDGVIGLGVGPAFPDFFQLSVAPSPVLFPQIVGAAKFKVEANRLNKFDDKIDLAIEGLPEGVAAKVAPLEKGKKEIEVELSGAATMAEGDYTFRVVGSGTFQNQPKRVVLDNVVLRVGSPVQASLAPAGPLSPGGKQAVKIQLTRFGEATGPVTLRFKQLPLGVTAPAETTIAEGQVEATVELAADAAAPLGKGELVVAAATTVKGRAVAFESAAVELETKKP